MTDAIEAVRQLLESRLVELDGETKQLRRALASLGEAKVTRKGATRRESADEGTARQRRSAARRRRLTRAPRGQRREQLLAAIKENPGARPAELARAIGIKPAQVHALIRSARGEKLIAKQGNGYALAA